MCRLLVVQSKQSFGISKHLKIFSKICKDSEEYQGHGWGMYYLGPDNGWIEYKNIKPIWEEDLDNFPKTKLLVAHARSAFQDKDIFIENNMPFFDGKYVFIFNGELQKVRIEEQGRIGAEKIFNFIKRFDKGSMKEAIDNGIRQLKKRTQYYKAINLIIATKEDIFLSTNYNERENYFSMHCKETENELVICSMPYPDENDWVTIENNTNMKW
jgi:glutamine amidotransferase